MYFKIVKGKNPAFQAMQDLFQRRDAAQKATRRFIKKLNAKEWLNPHDSIGGGIQGLRFETPPQNWKQVFKGKFQNFYYPKKCKANKELLDELASLPIVRRHEMAAALNYSPQTVEFKMSLCPGVISSENLFLIEVADGTEYDPVKGMVEITYTEYEKLKRTITKKK